MLTSTPARWPQNVTYLAAPQYHSSVPLNIRSFLEGAKPLRSHGRQKERSAVAIYPVSSPSHPAHGQCGLFAAKKIPARTHILDYLGEVHCDDRDSDYDVSLHRSQAGDNVGIDAAFLGNEARFINDYRGIRNKPNAYFIDARTTSGELRMGVWSGSEAIKKGEEILVSYGKGWWHAREEWYKRDSQWGSPATFDRS